MVTVLFVL